MRARAFAPALLVALGLGACSSPERVSAPPDAKAHLADEWFPYRASSLGITVAAAQSRDAALSEEHPPASFDRTTAVEAAAIYRTLCVSCHGEEGRPPERPGRPSPHAYGGLGARMGFFFGGDKMRSGLYRTIKKGGEPAGGQASDMPAWGTVLSREQTWGLVRHLESF